MRLNAYLARAGVASRRRADELITAGRVRVNGQPGQLNTFVGAGDAVEVDGRPVAKQELAYRLLHKPAGTVTTARDPHGRPTVVGPRARRAARRSGRPARRRHDGSAPAHQRRPARPPARPSALRGRQGLRGRGGGRPRPRRAAPPRRGRRARRRPHRSGACPSPRAGPHRVDDPRGSQAPGEADVRGGRPSGARAPPEGLRRPGPAAVSRRASGAISPERRSLRSAASSGSDYS